MIVFEDPIELRADQTLGQRERLCPRGRQVRLALITWPMVLLLGAMVAAVAYLPGVCDPFGQIPARKTLIGSLATVRSITFRQDGAMLSSVGVDCPMAIFNLTARNQDPYEHQVRGSVRFAAFSPNNRLLATSSPTATVLLHDLVGHESRTLEGISAATAGAACLAFSPDGTSLAVGQQDGKISLWDAQSRQNWLTFPAHEGFVTAMAFAPDGSTLASSGGDRTTRIWDLPAGRPRFKIKSPARTFAGLAYSPNGRLIFLSEPTTEMVWIWDMTTGVERPSLRGFPGGVAALAASPDGTTLAAADSRGEVTFWDIATFHVWPTRLRHSGVCSLAFAPDNSALASGGFDGTIHLWAFPVVTGD
jgi:WD40 repeat protein